ncbi:hypothetical protein ROS1_40630 [Roseibium sp. ROS1]
MQFMYVDDIRIVETLKKCPDHCNLALSGGRASCTKNRCILIGETKIRHAYDPDWATLEPHQRQQHTRRGFLALLRENAH